MKCERIYGEYQIEYQDLSTKPYHISKLVLTEFLDGNATNINTALRIERARALKRYAIILNRGCQSLSASSFAS